MGLYTDEERYVRGYFVGFSGAAIPNQQAVHIIYWQGFIDGRHDGIELGMNKDAWRARMAMAREEVKDSER
jgi:hypothetical protein